MEDYKKILKSEEYTFLHTNEHLGRHIILLGLAGSYSYGTNVAGSDIDIRGITLNQKSDLIGLTQFEQYVDDKTDTVVYAFHKMIMLLLNCNPNTIELLHSFADCRMHWQGKLFLRVKKNSIFLILLNMQCTVLIKAIKVLKMAVWRFLLIRL